MTITSQLCTNCQERKPRPKRTLCNSCARHREAQRQREKGLTCATCNRPPNPKTPLAGKARHGDYYCYSCLKHKEQGTEPAGPPRRANTPKPMPLHASDPVTLQNRRSLAHWLEAHRRTVARLAA